MPDIRDLLAAGAGPSPRDGFDVPATVAAVRRLRRRRRSAVGGVATLLLGGAVAIGVTASAPRPLDVVLAPGAAESSTVAAPPASATPPSEPVPVPAPSPAPASDAPASPVARLATVAVCDGTDEELATWFQPLVEPGTSRASSPLTFDRIAVAEALAVVAVPGVPAEQADCAIALRNGDAVALELRSAEGATLARTGSVAWFGPEPRETAPPTLGSGQPFDARLEGTVLSGSVLIEGSPGAAASRFLWVEASVPAGADRHALAAQLHLAAVPRPAPASVIPAGVEACEFYAPRDGNEIATCDVQGHILVVSQADLAVRLATRPVPVGVRTVSVLVDGYRYNVEAPLDVAEADVVATLASVLAARIPPTAPPPPPQMPGIPTLVSLLQQAADRAGAEVRSVTGDYSDPSDAGSDVTLIAELTAPGEASDVAVLRIAPLSDAERADPSQGTDPETLLCAEHRFTVTGAVEAARAVSVLEALFAQLTC